jgi:hypothetical protein
VQLSTVPTLIEETLAPRHVDLRPFAVNDGDEIWVLPGGLTRVALPEGELVVNSSQGGGSKDTWVLSSSPARLRSDDGEQPEADPVAVAPAPPIVPKQPVLGSQPPLQAEDPLDQYGQQEQQQQGGGHSC